ncbi:MAG: hypothetical protein PHQ23_05145 [Candidatus Wallbacteria bacterium]|nr:hypothetical protein [Candidatus Wallbacteria bacterium]
MQKNATTIRLPDDRLRLIRAIAGYEGRTLSDIFTELLDEYIERHNETMELLHLPGFAQECLEGLDEIKKGKGKSIFGLEG